MMKRAVLSGIVMMVLVGICPFAQATDSAEGKNWEFNLAPFYLWAVTLDGDVTMKRQTAPVKLDFGDIFVDLAKAKRSECLSPDTIV